MYVCICQQVTDREIKQAIENGACTIRDLKEQLGVATQCGKCCECACDILKSHQNSSELSPAYVAA
jgi:bacterioferritin-associated ferredoxin